MKIITDLAVKKGLCNKNAQTVLNKLLLQYNLPFFTDIDNATLFSITTLDKKRKGNDITVVLPQEKGKAVLKKMTIDEWREFITE